MTYLIFLIIVIIVYALYYAGNVFLDQRIKPSAGRDGEINLNQVQDGQIEQDPVSSEELMNQFRKDPIFKPSGATMNNHPVFDEREGVETLSEEEVSKAIEHASQMTV